MDKPSFKIAGSPCGSHGQYTFYKALRVCGKSDKILAIGDFFFVRIWQDSELVSIGELQLVWTDRVSEQTLVSLRLYFLPENTPDGRGSHGEHEVVVINEKVVLKAEDLLSWMCNGESWNTGVCGVWRGACATPPPSAPCTDPLTATKLDFADVDKEKAALEEDPDAPAVVVFSYPRYCRYRGVVSRLEGMQAGWLRDSLVAALGGYAAPTKRTRILYCKDTFEYPELEGHEFVCNHLAPRLKGRARGRRRRPDASDLDNDDDKQQPTTRRLSLRNGASASDKPSEEEDEREESYSERAFLRQLNTFYSRAADTAKMAASLKEMSLVSLYAGVRARGGYEAVCRHKLWRALAPDRPNRVRMHYERYLLPFERHEREKQGKRGRPNGTVDENHLDTIDVTDSPLREIDSKHSSEPNQDKRLRTPSPKPEQKDEPEDDVTCKPAEELNREFLASLPKEEKPLKITVKPVEKLIETTHYWEQEWSGDTIGKSESSSTTTSSTTSAVAVNGHKHNGTQEQSTSRPLGRSSLRHVRVKPTRPQNTQHNAKGAEPSPPTPAPRPPNSDDEIVEVPYKPKTPEIIDLDEYPESPQAQIKKKKLDILKEGGLEVTAVPPPGWGITPVPLLGVNAPIMLNPVQHQIMTQSLFQMYNIVPQNYANGIQPPSVIQATCVYGSTGPEKTVYGNPKDPFMPPPHILHGTPIKPLRVNPPATETRQDILDLTCKLQKPAVEIVRIPSSSPSNAQNLTKNYTLIDGKAVVGSNLEITLVNPKNQKNRLPQKRSSNGQFIKNKTPTPPKDYPRPYPSPSNIKKQPITVPNYQIRDDPSPTSSTSSKDSQIIRQDFKPIIEMQKASSLLDMQKSAATMLDMQKSAASILDMHKSAAGLLDMQKTSRMFEMQKTNMLDMHKSNMLDMPKSLLEVQKSNILEMQKANMLDMHKQSPTMLDMHKQSPTMLDMHKQSPTMLDMHKQSPTMFDMHKQSPSMSDIHKPMPNMSPFMDPLYMSALYSSLGQMDQRQLAMYRELIANQFKGYSGLLGSVTPTTKN